MLKMKKPKQFKIFYFPNPNVPYFRKVEIIEADNEAEAEEIFRTWYQDQITDNELFFGWVEEINAQKTSPIMKGVIFYVHNNGHQKDE